MLGSLTLVMKKSGNLPGDGSGTERTTDADAIKTATEMTPGI